MRRVVCDEDACHSPAFCHHQDMDDPLSLLPPHERRRLLALGKEDVGTLAQRRLDGEPLQYLEGTASFVDFDVMVDPRVLIPRPETEGLWELATSLVDRPGRLLDIGTGSGVLAIALARSYPEAEVHAVDSSSDALEVAENNARRLGVSVSFHHGPLFAPLPEGLHHGFDLVVSNPPYVAEGEWNHLPIDVRHEPRRALVAGPTGTEVLEAIAAGVESWVAPEAIVVCEMGETQGPVMRRVFGPLGSVEIRPDLAGRPRYVVVRLR